MIRRETGFAINCNYAPGLAKHRKHVSLDDSLAIGVDQTQLRADAPAGISQR